MSTQPEVTPGAPEATEGQQPENLPGGTEAPGGQSPATPPVVTEVSADQVLADVGGAEVDQSGGNLTPTQRAGLKLAVGVGVAIGVVILAVIVDYFLQAPKMPPELLTRTNANLADPATQASYKSLLENYTAVHGLAVDRATKLFDLVVVKALLPVFTTILGYIFGSRAAGASS